MTEITWPIVALAVVMFLGTWLLCADIHFEWKRPEKKNE